MDYEPNDEPTVEELQDRIGMLSAAYSNLRTALERIENIGAEAAASEVNDMAQAMHSVAVDALIADDAMSDPYWISEPTDEERAELAWHALTGE